MNSIVRNYTDVFSWNLEAYRNKAVRYIIDQGGTSSGKTIAILQLLYEIAKRSKKRRLISVVSESFPHLEKGVIRDFIVIVLGDEYDPAKHNKTKNSFYVGNSEIEFFAVDDPGKARGPRRDILYVNEVNNIAKEIFRQLCLRTREKIFVDFNPVAEFYIHENLGDVMQNRGLSFKGDSAFIRSWYKDNYLLEEAIIKDIEKLKDTDPNGWQVYGLGEIGKLSGLIFPKFEIIDKYPSDLIDAERIGLDFGYSNHPTGALRVAPIRETVYFDELIYESGLLNISADQEKETICKRFDEVGLERGIDHIIADCAEPKSIEEISGDGWFIEPCVKGKDSIVNGINVIKQHKIKVTKDSLNLIKELRNYQWKYDKFADKYLNVPVDAWNHLIDGARYGITDILGGCVPRIRGS